MITDLTLYTYGSGDFMFEVLTSVNFFFGHSMSLFKVGAMISLLLFAAEATGLTPNRGMDWTRFIRIYVIMTVFITTPYLGKVTVHDVITNEDRVFNYSDKKLPFGMIVPISIASTIGYRVIKLYQQNFEIDENLNFSYSGMNFAANFIKSLDNADSYDPNFNWNLDQYMQNCGFPLMNKAGALSVLRNSTDIFATLGKPEYTSNSRFVQQVDYREGKTPIVMSCKDAIAGIQAYYTQNANKFLQNNANRMGVPANQYQRFITSAKATSTDILKISGSASDAMKQAIAQNMIMASIKNQAQSVGNGTLALAAYDAEAFQEYKKSSELSGSAAARSVPLLVATGYALLFILYPIMIFLALVAGSYSVLKIFSQMLVAINLIPLLYEIFNFIVTFYLQKKLGNMVVGQGYSYDTSASIYSFTDNMIIAGNYLAASTPILAYAIASGSSMAFTSVYSHINDPAKSRADQAGSELAKGNMTLGTTSLDNASYNNISANKMDDQMIMSGGLPMIKENGAHGVKTNIGNETYRVQYNDQLHTKVDVGALSQHSLQNAKDHTMRTAQQDASGWNTAAQNLSEVAKTTTDSTAINKATGNREAKDLEQLTAYATQFSASLSAFGNGATISTQQSDNFKKNLSSYKELSESLSHSSNQDVRNAVNNTNALVSSSMHTVDNATSISQAMTDMKSTTSNASTDFSHSFSNWAKEKYGTDTIDMNDEVQHSAAQDYTNSYLNTKYGLDKELLEPSSAPGGSNNTHNKSHKPEIPITPTSPSGYNTTPGQNNGDALLNEKLSMQNKQAAKEANFKNNPAGVVGEQMVNTATNAANAVTGNSVTKVIDGVSKAQNKAQQSASKNPPTQIGTNGYPTNKPTGGK